jgi:hypothetical protein
MDEAAQISLVREYEGSTLGDLRRQDRLKAIAQSMSVDPSASFPTATKTHAALEAAYRLLRNEAVSTDGILAGHYEQTAARAALEPVVLAVHDTSIFKFDGEGERDGLGPTHGGQGFYGHFTLLVVPGETRRPLGVIALQKWTRSVGGQKNKEKKRGQSLEAARWKKGAALAEERVAQRCSLVHVMDREGDSYDLWAELIAADSRFVIRNSRKRVLADGSSLADAIAGAKTVVEREVRLSRRVKSAQVDDRKQAQARIGRVARLALSGQTVHITRPINCLDELPLTLSINFVHVREVGTNGNEPPVDWMLATTEPIGTVEEIERVVDFYRSRWVIEDYFKALKTGCEYEKRQLESEHTLSNALAIFVPIAWQLLLLRSLARDDSDAPASEALTSTQIEVLVAISKGKLPPRPTLRQALLAIAGFGGHIKNNGEPGWIVLGRGFQYLLVLEKGWKAAKRSDQ